MRVFMTILWAIAALSRPGEGAWLWDAATSAVDTVKSGANAVGNAVTSGANWVANTDVGKTVIGGAQHAGNKLKEGAQHAGNKLKEGAEHAGNKLQEGAEWVANSDAGKAIRAGAEVVTDCVMDVDGCVDDVKDAVKEGAQDAWEATKDFAEEGAQKLKECAGDVSGCAEDVKEELKQKGRAAKEAMEAMACSGGGVAGEFCSVTGVCTCKAGLQCVSVVAGQCMEYGNPGDHCVAGTKRCRQDSYCKGVTCKLKGKTGNWCMPGIERCEQRCQTFLDSSRNYCRPWDGAPEGYHCSMDRQCSLPQNLWCNGGNMSNWGKCSKCPHFCKNGCHSCGNGFTRITCGRMTTKQVVGCVFDQVADIVTDLVGCLFGIDIQCGIEFLKQTNACVQNPSDKPSCEFKIGCADEYAITKEYTKKWYARPAWITIHGSVGGKAYPNIKLNPAFGYVDIDFEWKGEISAFIKAEIEKKEGSLSVGKPLGEAMTIFSKFFIAYFVPVMIEVKVQPFFWGTLDAYAGGVDGNSNAEAMFGVTWTNWAKLKMHLDIKRLKANILEKGAGVGDGKINFLANGKVSIAMAGYIGLRMSVEVNKVGASLDLAGALKIDANVEAKIGNGDGYTPGNWKDMVGNLVTGKDVCVTGGVKVSAGVAFRTNVGFSIPNPKEAAKAVCNWNLKNPGASDEDKKKCEKYMPEKMPWADMCNELVSRMPAWTEAPADALRLLSAWNFYGADTEVKIPSMAGCNGATSAALKDGGFSTAKFSKCDNNLRGNTIDWLEDRVKIDCGDEALVGFQLTGEGCDNSMKWKRHCGGADVVNDDVQVLQTGCGWFWGVGPIFLDRHDVKCPTGRVLRAFGITRTNSPVGDNCSHWGDRRFWYECVKADYVGDVVRKETACNWGKNQKIEYLDRHAPKCDDGFAMTDFKVASCPGSDHDFKIGYGCVKTKELDDDIPVMVAKLEAITEHVLDHATILAKNVCFGAKGDSYGTFGIPSGVTAVDDIVLVHKSGSVSCLASGGKNGQGTKFGCNNDDRIAVFITDEQNNVIAPAGHHDGAFYFVDGFTGDSATLVFQDEVKWNGGWWYRVWYGEDLYNLSEDDNSNAQTCFDVYATGVEGMVTGAKMPLDCMHKECDYKAGKCDWCDLGDIEGYCCKRGEAGCPDTSIGTKDYYSCLAKDGDKWFYSKLDDGSRIKLGAIDTGSTPLDKNGRAVATYYTDHMMGTTEIALIASVLLIALLSTFAYKAGYCAKRKSADDSMPLLAA